MSLTKLAYVIYNDRPSSGLINTQVLSLLAEIKKQNANLQITLLAFWHPWIAWKYRSDVAALKNQMADAGINVKNVPLAIFPGRYFHDSTRLLPIPLIWTSLLFRLFLRRGFEIVHCRAYLASYTAAKLANKYGYQTVFDMRSLWPKEHVSIGEWAPTDPIYRMWERIELETTELSGATVVVNQPHGEEVERINSGANIAEIPICVDTERFRPYEDHRDALRAELGWSDNFILVYHGSLGLAARNIVEVAEHFSAVFQPESNVRLLVLTANRVFDIAGVMSNAGISSDRFAVKHPDDQALPIWVSAADAGFHAMSAGPDSHTRFGVKVVEYLSCGLPIIVNPYVGAAADLTIAENIGAVLDGTEDAASVKAVIDDIAHRRPDISRRVRAMAQDHYSVSSVARKYLELYDSLSSAQ